MPKTKKTTSVQPILILLISLMSLGGILGYALWQYSSIQRIDTTYFAVRVPKHIPFTLNNQDLIVHYVSPTQIENGYKKSDLYDGFRLSIRAIDNTDDLKGYLEKIRYQQQVYCNFSKDITEIETVTFQGVKAYQYQVIEKDSILRNIVFKHHGKTILFESGYASITDAESLEQYRQQLQSIISSLRLKP